MKKILYSMLIGLSGISAYAQTTEDRGISEFTKIEISGAANAKITQGENASVKVEADPEDMKNIITRLKDNTLIIKTEGNISNGFKVWVNYKKLESIDASGASHISTENTLNGEKLNVITSGASKAVLDVILKDIQSNTSGASSLVLSGATENHTAEVSGAASLKAAKMSSMVTEINTSGAASAKVSVNKKITANAGGASSIKYFGEPADANISSGKASSVESGTLAEGNVKLNDIDTTKIKFGNKKYIIIDDDHHHNYNWHWNYGEFSHWTGIDLGINGYTGSDMNVSLAPKQDYMSVNYGLKSMNWNLNLFEKDFHIYKNYVNLVTGIGFGFNTYEFKNKTTLNPDSSFTSFSYDSSGVVYSKNKLKMSYLQMPLMLEFNTSKKPNKAFHIAAGVLAGYKLTSRTKQFLTLNGYDYEIRRKDDYNLNPFKLDATVRIGYSGFTLYGTYSLTTLFEKNKGPQLYPFTIGVRIIPFSG